MRWALGFGWLLVAGFLQAEAPMDLNSPFQKVALVRSKSGEIEKREIKSAQRISGSVELRKLDGSVAVFPEQDVIAILPRLPEGNVKYTALDAESAQRLLQTVPAPLAAQAGINQGALEVWGKLRERILAEEQIKDEEEGRAKRARDGAKLQDWLRQAEDLRAARPEKALKELRKTGEDLAKENLEAREVVLEMLAALSQVQPSEKGQALPELSRLNDIQPRLIPDDLLGWLTAGVLLVSFFGLLLGLSFLSSSFVRFREGALLGGLVFGLVGLGMIGVLTWTWLPAEVAGQSVLPEVDSKMEELGIYLKNRTQPVYFFPKKKFLFSLEQWRSGVLGYLPASEESVGIFKVKMKKGCLRLTGDRWSWRQLLTALGIPFPVSLTFEGKTPILSEWENPNVDKVYLGRWPLPDLPAGLLKDSAYSIWHSGLLAAGLTGVKLEQVDRGLVSITVPSAGVKPKYELVQEEEKKESPIYRKKISAEELAREFQKGHGKKFLGKFVLLEGFVERVESGSEVSGGAEASKQTNPSMPEKEGMPKVTVGSFGQPTYDSFYLRTDSKPIRCLVKSNLVFVQDERKDIYIGPTADTISGEPFIKNGYRIEFLTEGRVEEVNRFGEIEVYGIRLDDDPEALKGQIKIFDPNGP